MKKQIPQPSNLELNILGVLWEQGPLTARQVLQSLNDGKQRAYTTVLSLMQGMERKGLLSRNVDAVTHLWSPGVSRRAVMGPMMKRLVRNVFGGRSSEALQQLLSDSQIDDDELTEIQRVIDNYHPQTDSES
ncbi:BlaI/MecI/CopY family transcriptional regulator [Pontiella sp.]|uniref:BlaI/MecI/CopY family transcriptional regulator n=1 Tax=Pontiella sp. TaxID=2837462 RepID=UPI0035645F27